MIHGVLPLSSLPPGAHAHVVEVVRTHPLRRRLLELGFVRGAHVNVLRIAPMGDPVELSIGGALFALRAADLEGITVTA